MYPAEEGEASVPATLCLVGLTDALTLGKKAPACAAVFSCATFKAASAAGTPATPLDRVFVRDGERCWMVQFSEIVLLESEGNYTRVYFGANKPLIPRSLTLLEERLDPAVFFRASRQFMVNLKAIERIDPGISDNLIVSVKGGHKIDMSRRQSLRLREMMSL